MCRLLSIETTLLLMCVGTMWACDGSLNNTSTPKNQSSVDMRVSDMASDLPQFDQNIDCKPLVIEPLDAFATTHQLVSFGAQGGSGQYRFELKDNASGAILSALTGAYLAGNSFDVTDTISLVDDLCKETVEATVKVVASMEVMPTAIELKPGQAFSFDVQKGSGAVEYKFITNSSGASVDPTGLYTAGNAPGTDRLLVVDARTKESIETTIVVNEQASFVAAPAQVIIPVGQNYTIKTRGGSSQVDVMAPVAFAEIKDGVISAMTPGSGTVTLKDRFTGSESNLTVTVVEALSFEQRLVGESYSIDRVIGNIDINGDGHLDAVLAHPETHGTAYRSGGVFIYEGSAEGLKPKPVRALFGTDRDEEFGHDALVVDVDNDGLLDLIVGARRAQYGTSFGGAVFVYKGESGKFFADKPAYTWTGENAGDELGYSVGACDFNNDGHMDIAVGAWQAEDRNAQPIRSTQGAVKVFLGYPEGFLPKADIEIFGKMLDENNAWVNTVNIRLGESLATGDFDGDGLCDLATGSQFVPTPDGGNNSGAVFIYRGRAADNLGPGGLSNEPSMAIWYNESVRSGGRFGRRIAMGDFNADGKSDLAVGTYRHDNGATTQVGATHVFNGNTLSDVADNWTEYTTADVALLGETGTDQLGWDVAVGDLNADGVDDLLALAPYNSNTGVARAGSVEVYYGDAAGLKTTPDVTVFAPTAYDRLGQGAAVAGDLDKDGQNDLLSFAARSDLQGLETGTLYAFYASNWDVPKPLEIENNPSGFYMGHDVAFLPDANGDGRPELVVGSPRYTAKDSNYPQQGGVMIYESTATGFKTMPTKVLANFYTNTTSDFFGWKVASAGDFNNDGLPDLAVVARLEDRPGNYTNSNYATNTCASGGVGDAGAIYIFLGHATKIVEDEPAFILHGAETSDQIQSLASDLDINGDGYSDVVYGSYLWDGDDGNNTGGYGVIFGRAADAGGKITPICAPDLLVHGDLAGGFVGWSLGRAGRIDGDACDDFVVGARDHNQGLSRQGQVRVVFGWGPTCGKMQPEQVALAPGAASARSGTSVAGGHDVDGDGVHDIVVGGYQYRVGVNAVGAAWLLSGKEISKLSRETVTTNAEVSTLYSFTLGARTEPDLVIGALAGEEFGKSVSMVPGLGKGGTAGVMVGAPLSNLAGPARSGGARLYIYEGSGLSPNPMAYFTGETAPTNGLLGEASAGYSVNGKPHVLIGGFRSNGVGLDQGAAYLAPIVVP